MMQRPLAVQPDLVRLAALAPATYPCLLQSVASGGPRASHDILLACPQTVLERSARGTVRRDGQPLAGTGFLGELDRLWQADAVPHVADGLPFHGGWGLFLGYELATEIEPGLRQPPAHPELPSAMALRCPVAVVVEHATGQAWIVAEPGHAELVDAVYADIERLADVRLAPLARLPDLVDLQEAPEHHYLEAVARARDYIAAGDVFQVNLAREWRAKLAAPPQPAALHAALARANPAPFAGLWQQPGWAIASSSPERLLKVAGRSIHTRPIAGTRPRLHDAEDGKRRDELLAHPKERAEHVMLIDLERNDLGRVCRPGSVQVDEMMVLESHPHVHHIVSNVCGELAAGTTPGQAIAACFPGGTITGCPKFRCMQIIAELEGAGRGAYTGALGYLDNSGDMDLNILIRSLLQHEDRVSLHAGAGIVHDSQPAEELQETRAKARGMLAALGVTP